MHWLIRPYTLLRRLLADVDPLFDKINQSLDQLMNAARHLPDDIQDLEFDLNALGRAGAEARLEIASGW